MKQNNLIVHNILYNGVMKAKQNHLYILVANSLKQQQELYRWYVGLHICEQRVEKDICHHCPSCRQMQNGNYINSVVIKRPTEKKSLGVDDVNELQEIFTTTAQLDCERFFCIEHADTMTVQAANSVLKFLEEPNGKTIGFLFVKNEQKLLPTIRSRGQIIRLIEETDEAVQQRIDAQYQDVFLRSCAAYLLQIGYDDKTVFKHTENFYAKIESYCTKIANGSPYIVAQTELEETAQKTKTGTMILELFIFVLHEHLKHGTCFEAAPTHVPTYMREQANRFYIALYHTLQKTKHHMSIAMLITNFSLLLEQE